MKKNKLDSTALNELNEILHVIGGIAYRAVYNLDKNVYESVFIEGETHSIFGISIDEFKSKLINGDFVSLIHPKNQGEYKFRFSEAIKNNVEKIIFHYHSQAFPNNRVREKITVHKDRSKPHLLTMFGYIDVEEAESIDLSTQKFEDLFSRSLAGVYRTHANGDIIECNQAFAETLGYESPEQLKEHNINEFYYYNTSRVDYIKELREKRFLSRHISILKRRDGRKLVVNNNVGIYPDENGELNIIEGTLIDVTQEHETSITLRQNEQKYKLLFEESNISILLLTYLEGDFYILQSNKHARRLLKADFGMLDGRPLSRFLINKPNLSELYSEFADYDKLQKEFQFRDLDGSICTAEFYFSYVQIEDIRIIQLVIKDITELRKNQEILENTQKNFKNIVETSPAGIFIFSDEELKYTNKIAEEIQTNQLKSEGRNQLNEVFAEEHYQLFKHLIDSVSDQKESFIEIEIDKRFRYGVTLVEMIYNEQPAVLIALSDVTLQYEFNTQKLRAELAEESNYLLEKEIDQHKKTQTQLLEKTSRLKSLIESSANLYIFSLNRQYRLTSMNGKFIRDTTELTGNKPKIGDYFFDIFPTTSEGKIKYIERIDMTFAGENMVVHSHFDSVKDGEIYLESFFSPIAIDGHKVEEISIVAHNVTDKVLNEMKIKDSESRNKALLQAIPDLIFRIRKDGTIIDFRANNRADRDLFFEFINTKEITGKKFNEIFLNQQTADDFMSYLQKSIEKDDLITHVYKVKRNSDLEGRTYYFENRYSGISDFEGLILARNITDQEENELRLRESLAEKEVLLKEVHHRVKNNLQVISSILNLQSSYIDDPNTLEFINESQNRIRSMSYIHESLYITENFSSIDLKDYIQNLVNNLFQSYRLQDSNVELRLQLEQVQLNLDQSIPCGLIINELFSNALKYAFPEGREGEIFVELKQDEENTYVTIQDNGIGLPAGLNIDNLESLGLSLVQILVEQLDGTLHMESKNGTKFLIIFGTEVAS